MTSMVYDNVIGETVITKHLFPARNQLLCDGRAKALASLIAAMHI